MSAHPSLLPEELKSGQAAWKAKLDEDTAKWNAHVDAHFSGFKRGEDIFLMKFPQVLSMVSPVRKGDIYFSYDKIKTILKEHPQELDESSFYDLPKLIANPVMVFNSSLHSTNKNALVVVLELHGKNGASAFVPISLSRRSSRTRGEYYMASSFYTQSKTDITGKRIPDSHRYDEWAAEGLLLYADTEKFRTWRKINKVDFYINEDAKKEKVSSVIQRVQFPGRGRKAKPSEYIVMSQKDLVNRRSSPNDNHVN